LLRLLLPYFLARPGYINVDQLQAETTLEQAAAKCGVTLDVHGVGKEVRLDCPFGCAGDHCGRREIAVNTENAQKIFMCHAYQCGFRGNLLTLMHGWLTGSRPSGDKLKGDEFHRVKNIIASNAMLPTTTAPAAPIAADDSPPPFSTRNVPLAESAEEKIRELATLNEKFVTDVAHIPPATASYVRRHPCLSPKSMEKWRVGVLPMDGGGDKRGLSLRGNVIYPLLSEDGQVLAWIGRDPNYEQKERDFTHLSPAERAKKIPPMKHRLPKGIHRGLELFGQQASRLKELGYRESIARHGIIVVEGFNDVIGLDNLGIPAVAVMSNRMTEMQGDKIALWAKQLANGKVTIMFDCEPSGIDGAKEALWFFAQRQLDVRLAWTPWMHGGKFAGKQPENLTAAEWTEAILPAIER
jgi:hypothetical protein